MKRDIIAIAGLLALVVCASPAFWLVIAALVGLARGRVAR